MTEAAYFDPGEPTAEHLRELQDAVNAMASDPAWKHRIVVLPPSNDYLKRILLAVREGGAWFDCECGWSWKVIDEHTQVSLEFVRQTARHTCLKKEEQ